MQITIDRKTFAGTPEDIVEQLATDTWAPAQSTQDWMEQAGRRAETVTGQTIRTDTARHFLIDLAQAGILTIDRFN